VWGALQTSEGLVLIRRVNAQAEDSFRSFILKDLIPAGARLTRFSSASVNHWQDGYSIISVAFQDGGRERSETVLLRVRDGVTQPVASRFLELGVLQKNFTLDGNILRMANGTISFDLSQFPATADSRAEMRSPVRSALSTAAEAGPVRTSAPPPNSWEQRPGAASPSTGLNVQRAMDGRGQVTVPPEIKQIDLSGLEGQMRNPLGLPNGGNPGPGNPQPAAAAGQGPAVKPANPTNRVEFTYRGRTLVLANDPSREDGGLYLEVLDANRAPEFKIRVSVDMAGFSAPESGQDDAIVIDDGLLKIPDVSRQIDLDRLDFEARFRPTGRPVSRDADGKSSSLRAWVDETFADFRGEGGVRVKPVSARSSMLTSALNNLRRERRNSVVFQGTGGDSDEMIHEILERLPRTWRANLLDAGAAGANIGVVGDLQKKVNNMIAASKALPMIWVTPDLQNLGGIGRSQGNQTDLLDLLSGDIDRGVVRLLGSADKTLQERVGNPRVQQAVQIIPVEPLTPAQVLEAMRNWLKSRPHLPQPGDEILEQIRGLAMRFNITEADPSRSVALMETIFTILEEKHGRNIQTPTPEQVNEAAKSLYRIPPELMDRALARQRVEGLLPALRESIVGHEHIIEDLYHETRRALNSSGTGRGPLVSIYIDGPPGTGKTEIMKQYARALGREFVRIEMNSFTELKDLDVMMREIGQKMRANPYAVILLDEVEKANYQVLNALLALMDAETFTYKEEGGAIRTASAKNNLVGFAANTSGDQVEAFFRALSETDKELGADELARRFFSGRERGSMSFDSFVQHVTGRIPSPLFDRIKIRTVAMPLSLKAIEQILMIKVREQIRIGESDNRIRIMVQNAAQAMREFALQARREMLSNRTVLALVERYVQRRLGGLINVDYEPNGRTQFEVELRRRSQVSSEGPGAACFDLLGPTLRISR
jgi:DNA polymerase III delta prime subunit